ncbi:TMF domain-containing protein [Chloropicon primus]|uniref:TATA element modulatory factor 1 TATA binding domain-containing protein n=1 Tax=Chloropicon primus TaxID=1764295 RepID=A0A5B8MFW3_9CHLO|nr:hypothetical protein A3770_02p18170 [Chloropicon primus]UPQ98508.1 TMF domain-containing protein [Chloropicon primus]|eukprot:QDZ19299.1 hypothetical protein A3770_02p18170 [Chloropicon primus]
MSGVGSSPRAESAQLSRKVKQLERKVATLGVLNKALQEENEELQARARAGSSPTGGQGGDEMEELTQEFAERLASLEDKLIGVTEQRDGLRAELHELRDSQDTKDTRIRDKDETIAALQGEGDGLARKIGELEGTVKKLRSSLREETAERERLHDQVQSLKKGFRRENCEGSGPGGGGENGEKFENLSKDLEQERAKYEAMSDKLKRGYEKQLEDYRARLEEEHKHEAILSREKEYKLSEQVQRLQSSLMELESTAAEREDSVRKENRFLEHKYQQLETKLAEMGNAYADQQKPYLAEIEMLRAGAQQASEEANAVAADFRARLAEKDDHIRVLEGKLLASETIAMSTEEVVIKLKETVADTNRQLEQQHQRVLSSVRKAAGLENEVKSFSEREQSLLQRIDRQEMEFERKLADKESEIRHLEDRYKGIIKTNGEIIDEQKEQLSHLGTSGRGEAALEDSNGLEDLLKDSSAKINWGLLQNGGRDQDGEVRSLKEQLRSTEESRNEALDECVKLERTVNDLTKRCDTAMILVGEGEERIEQLEDDIKEMKVIFHDQLSIMADQLQQATNS